MTEQPIPSWLLESLHDADSDFAWLIDKQESPPLDELRETQRYLVEWLEAGLIELVQKSVARTGPGIVMSRDAARNAILEDRNWDRSLDHTVFHEVRWIASQERLMELFEQFAGPPGSTDLTAP